MWEKVGIVTEETFDDGDMWSPGDRSIARLINAIKASEIALPQFQRRSVWGKANWLPFLTAVLLNRPTGTLLLLEVGDDEPAFEPRPLDGAPALRAGRINDFLLDGQQRCTTLYRALEIGFRHGRGDGMKNFVVDVGSALERGELTEEDFELRSAERIPGAAELARTGRVAIKTLARMDDATAWANSYAAATGDDFQEVLTRVKRTIPGFFSLASYKFPVLTIDKRTPLDVVVDIFEGMNRRGQRLNQFDLMVARLYKERVDGSHYDLRTEWADALEDATNLKRLGIEEEDGMLPLQLIAMQLARLPVALRPRGIKGISNQSVLEIPPDQVIGAPNPTIPNLDLKASVRAMDEAAHFLIMNCGVVSRSLLPQISMLIPLADQFLKPAADRLSIGNMKRWFFASGFSIEYYGSVNSYAYKHCIQLDEWSRDPKRPPSSVAEFDADRARKLDLKQEMSREGAILGTTLMALLIAGGALDWVKGQFFMTNINGEAEAHHVVPEKALNRDFGLKAGDRRPIAGLTPISKTQNGHFGARMPSEVLPELGRDADEILNSHVIDRRALENAVDKASYDAFLAERERSLREYIIQKLGLGSG